jgi:hypothetical protein
MAGWRSNHVAILSSCIQALAVCTRRVRDHKRWSAKVVVRAPATSVSNQSFREVALSKHQLFERFIAASLWVDIENNETARAAGRNAYIRNWVRPEPVVDGGLKRRILRTILGDWYLALKR